MNFKLLATSLALALSLTACNQQPAKQEQTTTPESTVAASQSTSAEEQSSTLPADAPTYTIGTISSFPPFVDSDEFGKPIGFDMEILKAIGEHEGFKVEIIVQPWQGLLDELNKENANIDIVGTGVVITPERQEKYSFSNPYLDTQWAGLLISKEGENQYGNFADVLANNKVYVTQAGSAGVEALQKALNGRDSTTMEVDSQFQELESVAQGKADVAYDISRVLQYYANTEEMKQFNFYLVNDENSEKQDFGYVVRKGNTELLGKINSGLKKIKEDGTYNKIYANWFGGK